MENVFDILKERGFIQQMTHEEDIRTLLGTERVTFYIGFDPTADSLTIGHFIPIMAMMWLQKHGHRPIAVVGGGTTMVGDPTDKTDMRRMMTKETIDGFAEKFKGQLSKYLDFDGGRAIVVNNAEWLLPLNYIDFLREVGVHFTVNRMLAADCYKSRYERGLSFLEFNYMLMQSYDFLELFRQYGCKLQFGGNDQWSNIIGGVELIRRVEGADAFGMTFSLLTTSEGVKMGKSQAGAVWLDAEKTSPYDLFQYLRNIDDADVRNCLSLLTFLPMNEVDELIAGDINRAKERLAFEAVKTIHGQAEAEKALQAARALFSGTGGDAPATEISREKLGGGIGIIEALELCALIPSRSEGRRLITAGGVSVNGEKALSIEAIIRPEDFRDGKVMLQKGKKVFHQLVLV